MERQSNLQLHHEKSSKIELLAFGTDSERAEFLALLTDEEINRYLWDWDFYARPNQRLPGSPGAELQAAVWRFWLVLAGRGFGKTKTGAETCKLWGSDPTARILIIGPTESDVRDVMIEGPSGLMSCYPEGSRPIYNATKHLIRFPSGAIGITRSAEKPERLRGPQFTKFWFDEICAARYGKEAWDQVMFGFRMPSKNLRGLITTTPKPIAVLKEIMALRGTVITRGSSDENKSNLAPDYISDVIEPYRGTRLGRQEIDAELLEDIPGALWVRKLIDETRITILEVRWDLVIRIVIGIDPAVTHNEKSDLTGIVIAGLTISGHVIVIDDLSMKGSPLEWASVAIEAFRHRRADLIVGEVNNGGDLVEANLRTVDQNIPFRAVWASRGKYIRAEPVANLYEQRRVHHVGMLGALEDEMCTWTPKGNEPSPNRMDALVWAVTELLVDPETGVFRTQFAQPYQISTV